MQSYRDSPLPLSTDHKQSSISEVTGFQISPEIEDEFLFLERSKVPRRLKLKHWLQIVAAAVAVIFSGLLLFRTISVIIVNSRANFRAPSPLDLSIKSWTAIHHHIPALSSEQWPKPTAFQTSVANSQTTFIRTLISDKGSSFVSDSASIDAEQGTMLQTTPTMRISKSLAPSIPPSSTAVGSRTDLGSGTKTALLPTETSPRQSSTSQATRKTLIVASLSTEDTSWIRDSFPDWDKNIYIVDDINAEFTVLKSVGHETSVYLTYIIDNYDTLPDYMVFLHARRYQWHVDDPMYDSIPTIKNLRLSHVETEGYASLRCPWQPSCPEAVRPDDSPEDILEIHQSTYLALKYMFPDRPIPEAIGSPCCAQFAITRKAALYRSKEDYERMRHWLWHEAVKFHDGKSGRIFEHLWHIIFGMDDQHCPDTQTCYCKLYGLCDLKCPHDAPYGQSDMCYGRYQPLNLMNEIDYIDWPDEGQGEDGRPFEGWWEEWYPPDLYDGFTLRNLSS